MPAQKRSLIGRNKTQKARPTGARPAARKKGVVRSLRSSAVKRGRISGMRSASRAA